MAKPRSHLRRAPIAEAVIDYRVVRREPVDIGVFSDLQERLGTAYQRPNPIYSVEARFGANERQILEPTQTAVQTGWIYQGDAAAAQFRIDGFTFNKLEPYTTWEQVFAEADRLWHLYVEIARPAEVSRLAVRYINRLRLPGPADLGYFLAAPPTVPEPIPQTVREFLTRMVVQDAELSASAIVIQALEAPVDPAVLSVLIDIDAFREVSLSPDDEQIGTILGQLRQLKNQVFFATITDRTVERYE